MTGARSLAAAFCALALVGVAGGCGGSSGAVDSGGLTSGDRKSAQSALDALHGSNVALQLVTITKIVESTPAACRVHLVSKDEKTFRVYVFWIPWLGSQSYTWLDMMVTPDAEHDTFNLGTEKPVLPGGLLTQGGRSVDPFSQDTTLLSRYGPQQAKKNQEVLRAHAGNTFEKPGAACQVLTNGDLRLLPP